MTFRPIRRSLAVLAALVLATTAQAGQMRINIANFSFSPRATNLNQGDHAVWIWTGGSHTCTSGDSLAPTPDGTFSAGSSTTPLSGATFSWKSDFSGTQKFFCFPHAPDMAGRLIIGSSGTPVSDFRLTKVQFGNTGGLDFVEIANIGLAAGDLGMYRLRVSGTATVTLKKAANTNLLVPSGGRVVVYINRAGTSTDTSVYVPSVAALPTTGSLALYVPNTVKTALTGADGVDNIIDYVAWGAGGQENEATAVTAGFWSSNAAIQNVAPGHTIAFCGAQGGQYGVNNWSEITVANFGTAAADCTTPTLRTSWGRIKTLYR